MEHHARDIFSSKIGLILAVSAAAVGMGNLWRFPTIAAENGGGTFLFVYVIVVLTFGLCMVLTEMAIGRRTSKSAVTAYKALSPKGDFIGKLTAFVPFIVLSFYAVVGAWVLTYFLGYGTGIEDSFLGDDFFNNMASMNVPGIVTNPMIMFFLFLGCVSVALFAGVRKGIEKLNIIFMPILLVLLVSITVYTLSLPGSGEGLGVYLIPDFSKISGSMILDAIGQAFYSLSIAMGITITYGSYTKKTEDLEGTAFRVTIIDLLVSFLAGLMIIPAVVMFIGIGPEGIPAGPGLIFEALPKVFASMPSGNIVAFAFFAMTFIAALTSAIALGEASVSILRDQFKISRMRAVCYTLLLTGSLGTLACLGFGPLSSISLGSMNIFGILDYSMNNLVMPIIAILTCVFIGHVIGIKVIENEVESSGKFRIKKAYAPIIKWVAPIIISFVLIAGLGIW